MCGSCSKVWTNMNFILLVYYRCGWLVCIEWIRISADGSYASTVYIYICSPAFHILKVTLHHPLLSFSQCYWFHRKFRSVHVQCSIVYFKHIYTFFFALLSSLCLCFLLLKTLSNTRIHHNNDNTIFRLGKWHFSLSLSRLFSLSLSVCAHVWWISLAQYICVWVVRKL